MSVLSNIGGDAVGNSVRNGPDRRLCVAPMMEWTDRHYRSLARIIAPGALLYTEMVVDEAIIHGNVMRLLQFEVAESPLALQLGGSDPRRLAKAAQTGEQFGYDEINLNIGCPSGRVQAGRFGACLMKDPVLVGDCVAAMRDTVSIPVTVKTRIGVDECDSFEFLERFVTTVLAAGCDALIVHARKAWLKGLSPKQNREIPALDYDRVRKLRSVIDDTPLVINGGIVDTESLKTHLDSFDGVMIGRAAYQNPMVLGAMQRVIDPSHVPLTRMQVVERYLPYIEDQLASGVRLHSISRHMLGLYQGQPGARHWRRELSRVPTTPDADVRFIENIMADLADAA